MGIWERNLIVLIIKYILRWFLSNEKNRDKKTTVKKKGVTEK